MCGRINEDGAHLFIRCKEVRKVWRGLELETEWLMLAECEDQKVFLHEILNLAMPKKMIVISLLWTWWLACNKVNAGEKKLNIPEVISQVRRTANNCELFFMKKPRETPKLNFHWSPPNGDVLKINVDGCFMPVGKSGG